jgi:hypothetical protein
MTATIQEIYTQLISSLSPNERLQLATLILNNLVQQSAVDIDDGDSWTAQDQQDIAAFSLQYAATVFADNEELVE